MSIRDQRIGVRYADGATDRMPAAARAGPGPAGCRTAGGDQVGLSNGPSLPRPRDASGAGPRGGGYHACESGGVPGGTRSPGSVPVGAVPAGSAARSRTGHRVPGRGAAADRGRPAAGRTCRGQGTEACRAHRGARGGAAGRPFWCWSPPSSCSRTTSCAGTSEAHWRQIELFVRRDWSMEPSITTLPGYHALMALAAWVMGTARLPVRSPGPVRDRAVHHRHVLLSRPAEGSGRCDAEDAAVRLPAHPVSHVLHGLHGRARRCCSCCSRRWRQPRAAIRRRVCWGWPRASVRQNNIVWTAVAFAQAYVADHGWRWPSRISDLLRYAPVLLSGGVIVAWLVFNRGQGAVGDVAAHPLGTPHVGNIFFMLFLSGLLFLPLWWGYRKETWARLRRAGDVGRTRCNVRDLLVRLRRGSSLQRGAAIRAKPDPGVGDGVANPQGGLLPAHRPELRVAAVAAPVGGGMAGLSGDAGIPAALLAHRAALLPDSAGAPARRPGAAWIRASSGRRSALGRC